MVFIFPAVQWLQKFMQSYGIWKNGGKKALITNPENIGNALNGKAGTWFVHDDDPSIGI